MMHLEEELTVIKKLTILTTLMLIVIVCLCGIAMADSADSDYTTNELEDGTLEITKYIGTAAEVVVPSEIDGKQVTKIGESAFRNSSVTSVTLPDGLT